MGATPKIKICGLTEPKTLATACAQGADYIGYVFYPPSPRFIEPTQAAFLIRQMPSTVKAVGLFVDAGDQELEDALAAAPVDVVQLHGGETPERVAEVKARFHRPVIKALPVRGETDVAVARDYEDVADWLLFDAKPAGANLPGGTGQRFDWSLLAGESFKKPWMLSGGLDADAVQEALGLLSPDGVDVSSGVEITRGVKDSGRITDFIRSVKDR